MRVFWRKHWEWSISTTLQYTRNHVNKNRNEISRANGAGRRPKGMLQELSTVEGVANDSIVNSG